MNDSIRPLGRRGARLGAERASCSVLLIALLAVSALFGGASCGSSEDEALPAPPRESVRPNFYQDVYPILAEHCLSCHMMPSAPARVQLGTYEGLVAAAFHVRHALQSREMPPWGIDSSGACGDWADHRWMSSEDIDVVLRWLDAGMPEGDPAARAQVTSDVVAAATPRGSDPIGRRIEVGSGYRPSPGGGTIRCFVVDPHVDADVWLQGLRFEGARAFGIKRISFWSLDSAESEGTADRLDAADPEPGYSCVGDSGVADARFLIAATWTSPTKSLPEGTGVRLAANRRLVAQIDYNMFTTDPSRGVEVDLRIARAAREAEWREVRASKVFLLPDSPRASAQARWTPDEDLAILGAQPQMRLRGRNMVLAAEREPGRQECMMHQVSWNMHTLREPRFYTSPRHVPAGSPLTLTCHYDTSGTSEPIMSGDTLDDEECGVMLYVLR